MESKTCRLPALLLLPVVLAACGGGGPANDVADELSHAMTCTVRNCTESTTLRTDEISMRFTATQNAGESSLKVSGFVSKSANLTTTVLLAPNESLSASVDGGPETPLRNIDAQRLDYELSLPASSAKPEIWLIFKRNGVRHISGVVMPPAFTITQPVGTPTLARSAGTLIVTLAPTPSQGSVGASIQGRCSRKDGSSFDVKRRPLRVRGAGTGSFAVDTLPLDQDLNLASQGENNNLPGTSLVSRCDLTVTWEASAVGTSPATLNKYSSFTGSRQAAHVIVYDAWL